ncbi:imidazole glycerol phosphate synthase subunit HisF [Buchnera aphidicola (Ceratoglyphina bambusae)]|uniref:imidazole glycerol phosphate synthase subunit HisF n=1 Tax=Buchnera aphidicola TaxID=9 RepID=UPI0031B889D5
MLAKRIIPCLDIKNNKVVKGKKFRNHKIISEDILSLVSRYVKEGADELVFYDITAYTSNKLVNKNWIYKISKILDIPFCVAGGIKSIEDAKKILSNGADKISINSSAIDNPKLISKLADKFGKQCIVVGIDSMFDRISKKYFVFKYTGDSSKTIKTNIYTLDWVKKVQKLGAGEIVLNVINFDGLNSGYDINQLKSIKKICKVPLIASSGAGCYSHFYKVFLKSNVDGALAASVFHSKRINIKKLKNYLFEKGIEVRL